MQKAEHPRATHNTNAKAIRQKEKKGKQGRIGILGHHEDMGDKMTHGRRMGKRPKECHGGYALCPCHQQV
jgi:hypothetical protein